MCCTMPNPEFAKSSYKGKHSVSDEGMGQVMVVALLNP
jgi:hypothetical protein